MAMADRISYLRQRASALADEAREPLRAIRVSGSERFIDMKHLVTARLGRSQATLYDLALNRPQWPTSPDGPDGADEQARLPGAPSRMQGKRGPTGARAVNTGPTRPETPNGPAGAILR
jgi:hypothetical protein